MNKPDIHRLIDFHRLLVRFASIQRRVHRPQGKEFVNENDTEHSYNLAMTAWFLAAYFPELDRDKLIRFALIHDLVEIHAGDTFFYGSQREMKSKKQRETAAIEQLAADWPDFPELTAQIEDYETHASEEAKFIYALDKLMPMLLVYLGDGYSWKHEGVTLEQQHTAKKPKTAVSKQIDDYYDQMHQLLLQNRHLFPKP